MTDNQLALFNYSELPTSTQHFLKEAVIEIQSREKAIWENAIAIGQKLTEVKERLPRGQFMPWIEKEFQWGRQTAQNYMKVSAEFGANYQDLGNLNGLAMTALTAIASESAKLEAPEQKQELIESVGAANEKKIEVDGKPLTESEIKTLLAKQRQDIGVLKNQSILADSACKEAHTNEKQAFAALDAQRKTENERIAAAKAIAAQETKEELDKEIKALEASVKAKENALDDLKKNPAPEMLAEIAKLEQNKRLATNELGNLTQRKLKAEQELKALEDRTVEEMKIRHRVLSFKTSAQDFFEQHSGISTMTLPATALLDLAEGIETIKNLLFHLERIDGDRPSNIVPIRATQTLDIEAN